MELGNCWERKACGRQPGGGKVETLGVCPASLPNPFDGTNRGTYGGRFCWAIAGTFCGGKVQGSLAQKLVNCLNCDFLATVQEEEGRFFRLTRLDAEDPSRRQA